MICWDGETMHARTIERLSWACGPVVREGWHHSDERFYDGMRLGWDWSNVDGDRRPGDGADHVGSIQDGLPYPDATFDYVVTHHGLMMLPEPDLVPALVELRRVTKSGGWLRVSVPDIEAAIEALRDRNRYWFPLEAASVDDAFCRYVTQGGTTRSVFTRRRLVDLLTAAGWEYAFAVHPNYTRSPWPEITDLDSRPDESVFMEAVNPG